MGGVRLKAYRGYRGYHCVSCACAFLSLRGLQLRLQRCVLPDKRRTGPATVDTLALLAVLAVMALLYDDDVHSKLLNDDERELMYPRILPPDLEGLGQLRVLARVCSLC